LGRNPLHSCPLCSTKYHGVSEGLSCLDGRHIFCGNASSQIRLVCQHLCSNTLHCASMLEVSSNMTYVYFCKASSEAEICSHMMRGNNSSRTLNLNAAVLYVLHLCSTTLPDDAIPSCISCLYLCIFACPPEPIPFRAQPSSLRHTSEQPCSDQPSSDQPSSSSSLKLRPSYWFSWPP